MSALVITYAVTEDFNGMPWMQDDDGLWGVVARNHGRTKWRHITASRVNLAANGACSSSGRHQEREKLAMSKDSKNENNTGKGNKEMLKQENKNVVVQHSTELENIQAAAKEDAGFEKILKFKKGTYFIGEDEVPLGTEYLAHTVGWTKCWIKFEDGEVAVRKLYRVANGEQSPDREDLDDLDLIDK